MVKKVYEMRAFELKKNQGSFAYVLNGNGACWQMAAGSFSARRILPMTQHAEIIKQGLGYLQIPSKKALTASDIARESYTVMFTTDKGISYTMICTPVGEKSTNLTVSIDKKMIYSKKVTISFQSLNALTDESEKIFSQYYQTTNKSSQPMGYTQSVQNKVSHPVQSKVNPPTQSKVKQPAKGNQPTKNIAPKSKNTCQESDFMVGARLNKRVNDLLQEVCGKGGEKFQCMNSPQTVVYICSSLRKSKSNEELSKMSDAALKSEMSRLCSLLVPKKKR